MQSFLIEQTAKFGGCPPKEVGEFDIGDLVALDDIQRGRNVLFKIFAIGIGDYSRWLREERLGIRGAGCKYAK